MRILTVEKQKEIRKLQSEVTETRATEDSNEFEITGYINKFNKRSEYMGFYEQVDRNAFDSTLASGKNIYAMYNHSSDKILGSTQGGSLSLSTDEVGLRFSLKVNPEVSYAKDVYHLVRSGDVSGCSFGFYVTDDAWSMTEEGIDLRTIKSLELIEVTITPFPAYADSEATSVRSYEQYKQSKEEVKQEEQRKIELELLGLELEFY